MNNIIKQKITELEDLSNAYIIRDGFVFTSGDEPANVFDSIVIRHPETADTFSPKIGFSSKPLEEHIELINKYQLEKAVVIADSIDFLTQCPSLKYLNIYPSDSADESFDYSPLYSMPEIRCLRCRTMLGLHEKTFTTVDYSQISGLKKIYLSGKGHLNFEKVTSLESLNIDNNKIFKSLTGFCSSENLHVLDLLQCSVETLSGIAYFKNIENLSLCYNKRLSDISSLTEVANTLKTLSIENCPKITDFSVLSKLENLEHLYLTGSNEIESLSFIKNMKKLKTFLFSVNVLDGDLTPCLDLKYASCLKGRKHYNLKEKDLPKKLNT
ncbi:MAG: leucine-rich repeat domain-containing protein [Clostridia bacterium]|nr:leucine-rich repeat domain-containing protein [Clostridia bacterium]